MGISRLGATSHGRRIAAYLFILLLLSFTGFHAIGAEPEVLANGARSSGSISAANLEDTYTFQANAGDRLVLRMGTDRFNPRINLYAPDQSLVVSAFNPSNGGRDVDLASQATNAGIYTVVVNSYYANGNGNYTLTLAQSPGTFVVPPDDQGGALTNGFHHTGAIDIGDLDVWSFAAEAGDSIILRMGTVGLNPWIRLFGPNGGSVATGFNAANGGRDVDLATQATNAGIYTVVVSSYYNNGAGSYVLTLAQSPEAVVVSAGDEGGPLTNGVKHTGSIDVGDLDVWTFAAKAGDSVILRFGSPEFNPWIRVFGPTGKPAGAAFNPANGGRDTDLALQTTNAGIYTVVVSSYYVNQDGAYTLTLAQAPEALVISPGDQGGALTNGVKHTGSIDLADLDVWTFSAEAGDSIILRMGTVGVNPWIRLFGPNGGSVATGFNAANGGRDVDLATQATNAGIYTVVVSSYYNNGAGSYVLTLAQSPEAVVVSAGDEGGPLTNGVKHTGSIDVGDLDVWTFAAKAGDSVILRFGSPEFNPWIRVFGPTGKPAGAAFNPANGGRDTDLALQTTNAGIYTVVVSSYYVNQDGAYTLTLAQAPEALVISPGDQGGALTNGVKHTGSIDLADLDVWTFSAEAGDSIILRMGTVGVNPWIRLFGPNGGSVATGFNAANGGRDVDLATQATNAGIYTVVVSSYYNNGAGSYVLTLAQSPEAVVVSAGDEGGPLTNGVKHTGSIDVGDLDVWTFAAKAGDSVILRMGSPEFNPWIRVFGPTGKPAGAAFNPANGGHDTDLALQTTNAGIYTVVVSSYYANVDGAYILTLAHAAENVAVSGGDEGGPLSNGFQHKGNLDIGDLDLWTFSANAGDSIVLRMGAANYNPWIRLYGPEGRQIQAEFNASNGGRDIELSLRSTNSGVYAVVITSYYANGNGAYILTLARSPGGFVIADEDQGGSLTNAINYDGVIEVGDIDMWRFVACRNHPVTFRCEELTGTSAFNPMIRLYGKTGALLASTQNASEAVLNYETTNSGPFTLLISSGNLNQSGTYRLTGEGIADNALSLCLPLVSGSQYEVDGIGGQPNGSFVLVTSTNFLAPLNIWLPIETNQFDLFGVFEYLGQFDSKEQERYFRAIEE